MAITFRPALLPQDQELIAEIFVNSVLELGAEDYDEDELAAWVSIADDEEAFAAMLRPMLTLIASVDGEPAGFAALKDNVAIEMLYVAPDHARQGIATALVQAMETLAAHRGTKSLTTDASDLAKPLFERLGFKAQRRNTVHVAGVWLGTTTLTKTLAEPSGGKA